MAILSKCAKFLNLQTINSNCYETVHTWEPDCYKAIWTAVPDGFLFCLKTYGLFYLVATLISKRDPRKVDWIRYIKDTLRSSCFLTTNLILYLFFFCRIRHSFGFFTPINMGGLSSFCASFFAILVEKQRRRPALTLYLLNLASETLFRQMVHHGYMVRLPYGECFPFAGGLCLFMYLFSQGRLSPSLTKFMNLTHRVEVKDEIIQAKKLPDDFHALLHKLRTEYSRTDKCSHPHSCVSVATESFLKNFTLGFGISSALVLVKNIVNIFKKPMHVVNCLLSKNNFKLAVFFGLMPLLFHTTRCSLNRVPHLKDSTKNMAAAVASSASMAVAPNVTIAMYTLWKGIEAWYQDKADRGKLPYIRHADIFLYTLSTGYVLWQAALEPHAIRKGYQNFLMGLTGGRLALFNRHLYDHWGYKSSLVFPYISMKIDPKYVTVNPLLYQPVQHP